MVMGSTVGVGGGILYMSHGGHYIWDMGFNVGFTILVAWALLWGGGRCTIYKPWGSLYIGHGL